MNKIDFIVFGATGFTGKHVVNFLVRARKEKEYEDLKWGVAGRSKEKLLNLIKEIENMGMETSDLVMVESNVDDEDSLKAMTEKCKVLINCVGPFSTLGEPVVKACIKTGTHYVDITAEALNFITVYKEYNESAQKANVLIIPACGFCNIPIAAGIMFLRDNFEGELNTAESYLELGIPEYAQYPGPNRALIHYGTWISLVHVLKDMRKYLSLRGEIISEPVDKEPLALKKSFLHRHDDQCWFPYPGPDADMIALSERQLEKAHKKKITHFKAYATFPRLMANHPKIFSLGYASHEGPTSETREKTTYAFTLIGKQWEQDKVTKAISIKVSGKDPGYDTTAATLVLSAITILREYSKMPKGGVLQPEAAFNGTNIVNRLMQHDVNFQIIG